MRRWAAGGWVAGLVIAGLVGRVSAVEQRDTLQEEDQGVPEFSAERLGEPDHDSILDMLEPEEREAVTRSGMSLGNQPGVSSNEPQGPFGPESRAAESRAPQGRVGRAFDTAGKIGVSVLGVALSLAAVVAPFFLAF